jgi:hypothetical protein
MNNLKDKPITFYVTYKVVYKVHVPVSTTTHTPHSQHRQFKLKKINKSQTAPAIRVVEAFYWMDNFNVPGGGARNSTYTRPRTNTIQKDMVIVSMVRACIVIIYNVVIIIVIIIIIIVVVVVVMIRFKILLWFSFSFLERSFASGRQAIDCRVRDAARRPVERPLHNLQSVTISLSPSPCQNTNHCNRNHRLATTTRIPASGTAKTSAPIKTTGRASGT